MDTPNKQPDMHYQELLDTCWQSIQADTMTLDVCLARYPNHAQALKQDLSLAIALNHLPAPMMSADAIDALEDRLFTRFDAIFTPETHATASVHATSQAQTIPQPARILRPQRSFWLGKSAAVIALIFLAVFGGVGTTVAASADSMPDQPLYVVKRLWESVIVLIAKFAGNLDDVWLQIAQTRLEESLYVIANGDPDLEAQLLQDLADAFAEATLLADETTRLELVTFAVSTQQILANVPRTAGTSRHNDALERTLQALISNRTPQPADDNERPLATATLMMSLTPLPTQTFSPSATWTVMATVIRDNGASTPDGRPATSTPRFAPTATRTPTPTPTLTPTATPIPPSITPSVTWTALPSLPTITPASSGNNGQATQRTTVPPQATTRPPSVDNTQYFIRQTDQAVQLTQTADANGGAATEEARP